MDSDLNLSPRHEGGGLTFGQPPGQTEYDFTADELHWPEDAEPEENNDDD